MNMGKRKEKIILQSDTTKIEGYEQAGSAKEWREQVGQACAENHRLVLAISASFAAPLLHHLDQQGFGINFRGSSSIGKTTILRVAKSVMGDHAHIKTWRATSSALESVAAMHNDNVLFLDEMGEADPKEIGATAYMLSNGQGKLRQTRNITLRPSLTWRLIYLSTGEVSLADMMAQVKQKVKAGQAVRVIDLMADAGMDLGIFDKLPESMSNGADFADHLKEVTKQQHGHVFIEYLTELVKDLSGNMQTIREYRDEWKKVCIPEGADSQVKRVGDSFATLAAGGELATDFGLTGWEEGESGKSAEVCFSSWIKQRGGLNNQEEVDILRYIKKHFEEHGSSKYTFNDTRARDDKTMYRMGFFDKKGDYFVLPLRFESELCEQRGFDKKQVIRVLIEQGYLLRGGDGRSTILKRLYTGDQEKESATTRVYHIDSSIISGVE